MDNNQLREKHADYNAAELIFGKKLTEVFKKYLATGMLSDLVSRIPKDAGEKSFYDGLVAGLLFSYTSVRQSIYPEQAVYAKQSSIEGVLSVLAFILLVLGEHTKSPGLDLLFEPEIDALFNRLPDKRVDYDYDSTIQEIQQTLDEIHETSPQVFEEEAKKPETFLLKREKGFSLALFRTARTNC